MIHCPKCGFEQPKDVFCANCGVNMQTYKEPIQTLVAGIRRSFRSFFVIILILAACYFVLNGFESVVHKGNAKFRDNDIEGSTQFGVSAGSLASDKSADQPSTAPAETAPEPEVPTEANAKKNLEPKEKKFDQVNATFQIAEALLSDYVSDQDGTHRWHVVNQVNPLNTFLNQEMILKKSANTFSFDDNVVRIDMSLNVEEITEKEITLRINSRRSLKGSNNVDNISANTKIPINGYLILSDDIPRQLRLTRVDTILSTLFHSQAFLSRSSEMVQIIKIENPRNVPQE